MTVASVKDVGITDIERRIHAAAVVDLETVAYLRDEPKRLKALDLGLEPQPTARGGCTVKLHITEPLGPGGGGYNPSKRKWRRKQGRLRILL